jgi:hypothetical protein
MSVEQAREADRHRGNTEELLQQIDDLRRDFLAAQMLVASVQMDRELAREACDAEVGQFRREIEAGVAELGCARLRVAELERDRERSEIERRAEVVQLHVQMARLATDHQAARAAEQEARQQSAALASERDNLRAGCDLLEDDGRRAEQRSRDEEARLIRLLGRAREESAHHSRRVEALSEENQRLASEIEGLRAAHVVELRKVSDQLKLVKRRHEVAAGGPDSQATSVTGTAMSTAPAFSPESREVVAYRDLALGQWNSARFKKSLESRRGAEAWASSPPTG